MLRALARQITGSQAAAMQAQAAADPEHGDTEAIRPSARPAARLPGHRDHRNRGLPGGRAETGRPPLAVGRTLVSVLSGRRLRPPVSEITLSAGDRVSLLIPVPQGTQPPHADGGGDHTASQQASTGSNSLLPVSPRRRWPRPAWRPRRKSVPVQTSVAAAWAARLLRVRWIVRAPIDSRETSLPVIALDLAGERQGG